MCFSLAQTPHNSEHSKAVGLAGIFAHQPSNRETSSKGTENEKELETGFLGARWASLLVSSRFQWHLHHIWKQDLEPCCFIKFLTGLAEQTNWKDLLTRSDIFWYSSTFARLLLVAQKNVFHQSDVNEALEALRRCIPHGIVNGAPPMTLTIHLLRSHFTGPFLRESHRSRILVSSLKSTKHSSMLSPNMAIKTGAKR